RSFSRLAGNFTINGLPPVGLAIRKRCSTRRRRAEMKTRIGVLTSGGDCPGLNAVLRGVALAAEKLDLEVVGFKDGFEGLLPAGEHIILDRRTTSGIMPRGGTIIGTTNRGHFVAKVGA